MNDKPELLIEAGSAKARYWHDLWSYKGLLYFLAWRDILVRYKQTVIGIFWALLRPFVSMVVFTVVFGGLADLPSEGDVPYPVLAFSGVLPWQLFTSSIGGCSGSIAGHGGMITKIYFPRLILPLSALTVSLVDFLIAGMILLGLMAWYNVVPSWRIIALPFFTALALGLAMGFGLCLAVLNVRYRDVRHILPFIIQLGVYISPVGFSSSIVPDKFQILYSLNPMVAVIDGFRWSLIGSTDAQLLGLRILPSLVIVVISLATGLFYFRKMEHTFADVI